ncbi:phage tail tube protein, partial [Bartonella sp. AC66GZZY]|uniref:phage tail tube protein n=1 Tax=Bartonella sp. AC66GZZY TaxID=3243458 RepID=UPI0035D0B93F
LGLGRDPTAPFQDVINVDGDIVVPVDLRNIGYWLKALFGAPATNDSGPYAHDFVSGEINLPSLSFEVDLPDVPDYPFFTGVCAIAVPLTFIDQTKHKSLSA